MILRIKDAEGNIQEVVAIRGEDGKDGENYVLTDADKQEIANLISSALDFNNYYTKTEIDNKGYLTEEEVLELISANMPASSEGVSY